MSKVQHFEIPAEDLNRAKNFYKKTFEWVLNDIPNLNYTIVHTAKTDKKGMISEKGVINGGIMKKNNNITSPVIVITVKDIDESIESIKKNGGKIIVSKTQVGDMGLLSYFQDTEKNILGIWQALKEQ